MAQIMKIGKDQIWRKDLKRYVTSTEVQNAVAIYNEFHDLLGKGMVRHEARLLLCEKHEATYWEIAAKIAMGASVAARDA